MPHKMLIVDDEAANLRLLERLFRRDFQVLTAESGVEAMRVLEQHDVALIITDQRMPGMTGIELLKRTAGLRPHTVRIILTGYTDVEALVEAINCGQVYKYVTKPWDNAELRLTVERAVEHYETNKSRHDLALANGRLVSRMKAMTREFVRALGDALEAKDEYLYAHARRVSGYAAAAGRRMGLDDEALARLTLAASLHNVGHMGTPAHLLSKSGPLTDEESAVMRLHPKRGARVLAGIGDMEEVAQAVLHYRENFDGTGYPGLLRGARIPQLSRVIRVADAYDAMTDPRPGIAARTHEEALARLGERAGSEFDPEVVRAFGELDTLARIRRAVAEGSGLPRPDAEGLPRALDGLAFGELVGLVEDDLTLAALVLREANASSGETGTTARLSVACTRLGETHLREAVARAYALGASACTQGGGDERFGVLRERSLRCAEAARLLADKTAALDPEDAYALGLLQDVGEALLLNLFPAETSRTGGVAEPERGLREAAAFGADHAQVGRWVLEACGVPRHLAAAVQAHHDVANTNSPPALLLHLADAVARADSPFKVAALDTLDAERLFMLGLSRNDLFRIHACVASALERRLNPVC